MKRIIAVLLSVIMALGLTSCASPAAVTVPQEIKPAALKAVAYDDYDGRYQTREENPLSEDFITALQDFSAKIASQTLSGQSDNMCVSPISLFMALSLVTQGANGETRAELLDAMCLSNELAKELPTQTGNLMRRLYTDNEMGVLKLANSIWKQNGTPFEQKYLNSMAADFYASLFSVDFSDSATGSKVGEWIADNTGGLLAPTLEFDPRTLMALVNTVYLTDQWVDQFNEDNTATDDFNKADGTAVICDFMNREALTGAYRTGNGFTAAPLSLKNSGEMLFILPDEGVSPSDLLSDPSAVADMLNTSQYDYGKIIYKVPKFSFGAAPKVEDAVRALGVRKAFESDADFTGILNDQLWISAILQETHVGVDENGVQAAAYTLIAMCGSGMPQEQEPIMITLDRPFIFAIISNTGAPLFIGVVNDPTAA